MEQLRERIVNTLDADTLVDILDIGIEELVDILEPQIRDNIDAFDFLEREGDYED